MQTVPEVYVSMQEFLRTGEFGRIKLGDSPEKLKSAFGPPHEIGGTSARRRTPGIWKYGDVEFFLSENRQRIWSIFCDTFEKLTMGPTISLDRWFFEGNPSCEAVERDLSAAGMPYVRRDMRLESAGYLLCLNSGIDLLFSYGEEEFTHPGKRGLFGFSISDDQLG